MRTSLHRARRRSCVFVRCFAAALAGLAIGCADRDRPARQEEPAAATTAPAQKNGYDLSGREAALLHNIAESEEQAIVRGEKTMLIAGIPAYPSDEIARQYARDRAAADRRFLGKTFIIRGEVAARAGGGAGGAPRLTLRGSTAGNGPRIEISPYLARTADLPKMWQRAAFACNGGGFDGAAVCTDCMPIADYAREVAGAFERDVRRFLSGHGAERNDVPPSAVLVIALARVLPEDSTCFSTGRDCRADISRQSTRDTLQKQARSVADELRGLGLDLPL